MDPTAFLPPSTNWDPPKKPTEATHFRDAFQSYLEHYFVNEVVCDVAAAIWEITGKLEDARRSRVTILLSFVGGVLSFVGGCEPPSLSLSVHVAVDRSNLVSPFQGT